MGFGGGVTDVPVTITLGAFAKAYDGTAVTTNYNVTGWPSDTTDELIVTKIGSAVTPGTYHFDDIYSYSINYNDNPQKYNYIVTTDGSGSITSRGSTPTPPPTPTPPTPTPA